jgi:hypothetical protein
MDSITDNIVTDADGILTKESGELQTSKPSTFNRPIDLPATHKCVVIVDQEMPVGFITNTAAVLSLSIGKQHPEIIGQDMVDYNGNPHQGITVLPVPILKGTAPLLHEIREKLRPYEHELTVVDLITATRTTQNYAQYSEKMLATPIEQLSYCGIALYGTKKLVNKFTGNLGLLR